MGRQCLILDQTTTAPKIRSMPHNHPETTSDVEPALDSSLGFSDFLSCPHNIYKAEAPAVSYRRGQGGGETNHFSGPPRDSEHFKEGASQKSPGHGATNAYRGPGIPCRGTTHRGPPRAEGVVPVGGPRGGAPHRGRVTAKQVDFYQVQPKKKIFFRGSQRHPRYCRMKSKWSDVDRVPGRHG